jgi:hypothetical protein
VNADWSSGQKRPDTLIKKPMSIGWFGPQLTSSYDEVSGWKASGWAWRVAV